MLNGGASPIVLKKRHIVSSNYNLLEAMTGNKRRSLCVAMRKYKLDPSNYDDVATFIYLYMEKKFMKEFRAKKLAELKI